MADTTWAYHAGSRAVPARAGVLDQADRNARGIGGEVPEIVAEFLADQPLVVAGLRWRMPPGGCGARCVADGPPASRVAVADAGTCRDRRPVPCRRSPGRPGAGRRRPGRVSTGVIEPDTRRRVRIDGVARRTAGWTLRVAQPTRVRQLPEVHHPPRTSGPLPGAAPPRPVQAPARPSHRAHPRPAGPRSPPPTRSSWPRSGPTAAFPPPTGAASEDRHARRRPAGVGRPAAGNAMFLSLGNLEQPLPESGAVVVDWRSGATLQVTGRAHVAWATPDDRTVVLDVDEAREVVPH